MSEQISKSVTLVNGKANIDVDNHLYSEPPFGVAMSVSSASILTGLPSQTVTAEYGDANVDGSIYCEPSARLAKGLAWHCCAYW